MHQNVLMCFCGVGFRICVLFLTVVLLTQGRRMTGAHGDIPARDAQTRAGQLPFDSPLPATEILPRSRCQAIKITVQRNGVLCSLTHISFPARRVVFTMGNRRDYLMYLENDARPYSKTKSRASCPGGRFPPSFIHQVG